MNIYRVIKHVVIQILDPAQKADLLLCTYFLQA